MRSTRIVFAHTKRFPTICHKCDVTEKKNFFFSETPDLYPSVRLIVDPGSTIRPPPPPRGSDSLTRRGPHTRGSVNFTDPLYGPSSADPGP